MRLAIALAMICTLLLSGCGWLRVHKVTVQQGNLITQTMIDKLKPGMSHSQVAFIMGEPIFRDPFEDKRWDYVYTVEVPGYYSEQRVLSLFFANDLLAYFTGDYAPSDALKGGAIDATPAEAAPAEAMPAEATPAEAATTDAG